MPKNSSLINNFVTKLLFPYILCFAFYIQVLGEVSPGGGFQAGSILASCFISYDLSVKEIKNYINKTDLLIYGSFGALIYLLTGFYPLYYTSLIGQVDSGEGNFLRYLDQSLGIGIVEFGVGITVSSIMTYIYMEIKDVN